VIRRYYDEGEQAVSLTGPTTPYYYAQDHLGSVRDLVNTSGQVLASYDYDPYGNPIRTMGSGSARADYRYAGLFYHAPSGLYLTHYRVYDPVTARWLSRDPIEEAGGVNLYAYVDGNPVNYSDPLGLHHQGNGCVDGLGNLVACPRDICKTAECAAGILPNPPPATPEQKCRFVFKLVLQPICTAAAAAAGTPTVGTGAVATWAGAR